MTEYVAGFMFDGDRVALIRKTKPAWQAGRLNGIGGKIEPGETPEAAMHREFQEETGFSTVKNSYWYNFAILYGEDFQVYFFYTHGPLNQLKTTTDEEIVLISVPEVTAENCIPNLTWLIPLAKSMDYDRARLFKIQEVL